MCHERRPLAVKNTPRLTRTTPPECWNIIINHEILLNFYSFFNADNAIPSRIDLILKHYEGPNPTARSKCYNTFMWFVGFGCCVYERVLL